MVLLTTQTLLAQESVPQAATVCDLNDGPSFLESEHFYINYTTVEGGLTIQDYADMLEAVYDLEITQYGWAIPPLCTAATCGGNANPWGKYPVQVTANLGQGVLGYVTGGGLYSGYYVGDNPNTTAVESSSATTCMVLPNDFEQFGSNPLQMLKETVAHEFLHAIQEGYGDDAEFKESNMWYESTAVYIEDEVVDDSINDHQYLWPRVENCLADWPNRSDPEEISEYSNFLLFRYAAERLGGTHIPGGGEDVIQTMWENIAAEQPAITAFDNALRVKGSTLPALFHDYAISTIFSRSCDDTYVAPYCFAEGDDYRATSFSNPQTHGTMDATASDSFSGAIMDDFAVNWIKLPTNARFEITLQNSSAGGQLQASIACDTGAQIRVTPFSDSALGGGDQAFIAEVDTNECIDVVAVITNHAESSNANVCTARSYTLALSTLPEPKPEPEPQPNSRAAYFPIMITSN